MMANALYLVLLNVDKIGVWTLMDKEELGIYAVQSHITNFIMLAPGAVAIVLFPSIMECLGRTNRPHAIETYLTRPTLLMGYLACPMLGLLYFCLHLPINWLLPKYVQAVAPGQILILASFFLIISRVPATILISMNRQKSLMLISMLAIGIAALGNYFFIQTGIGLVGAAIGSAVGFGFYAGMVVFHSFRELKIESRRFLAFQLKIFTPFLMSVAAILLIDNIFPATGVDLLTDLSQTGIKVLVFLAPSGVGLLFMYKYLKTIQPELFKM
jgi:O-antigen/teichoic acid export membrane protein